MCSLSRYLVVGGFAGIAASSLTRSDLVGVLAAAVAVLVVLAAERVVPSRLGRSSCALPVSTDRDVATSPQHSDDEHHEQVRVRTDR